MFCSKCGRGNNYSTKFCIVCGQPLEVKKSSAGKRLLTVIGTAVLLLGGGAYGSQHFFDEDFEGPAAEDESIEEAASKEKTVEKTDEDESSNNSKTELIKDTQDKVFTILTDSGLGSGFLFNGEGMVVTNAHVVAGFVDVMVRDSEGNEYPGEVIGISDTEDIALIEVDAFRDEAPLSIEDEATDVGTEVIALGSPNGLENSASIGYLTGVDRDISYGFEYENVYQVDVQIAPGSSGGPLMAADTGKVIGINSLLYNDGNAIGFSIPVYSVKDSLDSWARNPMSDYDVAALFGVYIDGDYSDDASYYEEEYEYGEESRYLLNESDVIQFIEDYRHYYEMALDEGDFYYIEDMLLVDSEIYYGMKDFIEEIYYQDIIYDFTGLEIMDVETYETHAYVSTYETFDFLDEYGDWSFEERYRTYTVVSDFYGYYIAEMKNN